MKPLLVLLFVIINRLKTFNTSFCICELLKNDRSRGESFRTNLSKQTITKILSFSIFLTVTTTLFLCYVKKLHNKCILRGG